jgi:hypothetical protein
MKYNIHVKKEMEMRHLEIKDWLPNKRIWAKVLELKSKDLTIWLPLPYPNISVQASPVTNRRGYVSFLFFLSIRKLFI